MRHVNPASPLHRLLLVPGVALVLAACSSGGQSPAAASAPISALPVGSLAPDASGGTTTGDIPDNAVFLTYQSANPAFAIQYVEGWQITPQPAGVAIRDKDSSETVAIVGSKADVAGYVASTDLPALQAQAGFQLVQQDTFTAGAASYIHVAYHVTSPPDAVTGKQVALAVDRYYVPGSGGLAIVTLATPSGVDNIDQFHRMIASFAWS